MRDWLTDAELLLIPAVLLVVSAWSWAGRSRRARWWVGRPFMDQLVLGVAPGVALVTGTVVLGMLFGGTSDLMAVLVVLPILVGIVLILAGIFALLPRWWGPRWYRNLSAGQRRPNPRDSALAAAATAYVGRPEGGGARELPAAFRQAKPLGSWHGGWVHDPDTDERVHGMSWKGTVDGRLTLYPTGMVFMASHAEDALRGKQAVVVMGADDITGVQVVPPRAGADGQPRKGRLYRSRFPRLVIRTAQGTQVFDVARGRASNVAEQLATLSSGRR
ncbi:MAG: hypothetical protein JF887_11690 [Candidatus Dormibacteraeota bacterium]|uniref:Uncharacterized protein n=1 Tax=Candidatus Amunia macphersoniae TaxID=3127014 RepID=A0A934NJU4_9BACT|nr:hypothetical protein [Candidatus Dormibacteraeota bacterium]